MSVFVCGFVVGVATGLRSMTPVAAISWAARLSWMQLQGSWLGFLGDAATPYVCSLLALAELVTDKLPKTPSRKAPGPFIWRILMGSFSGAAVGVAGDNMGLGLMAGALGAIAGTYGGYEFRSRLVKATGGKDLPIALLEDVIAIGLAFFIVTRF